MFFWENKELKTMGDIMNAIASVKSREEAIEFMRQYSLENPHAKENVGYITGYFTTENADRIMDWFDVEHPYFGKGHPSMKEALNKGIELGKKWKEEDEAFASTDITFKVKAKK